MTSSTSTGAIDAGAVPASETSDLAEENKRLREALEQVVAAYAGVHLGPHKPRWLDACREALRASKGTESHG